MRHDPNHDLAFCPLEIALQVASSTIYTLCKVFQHLQEATGKIEMIGDLTQFSQRSSSSSLLRQ